MQHDNGFHSLKFVVIWLVSNCIQVHPGIPSDCVLSSPKLRENTLFKTVEKHWQMVIRDLAIHET